MAGWEYAVEVKDASGGTPYSGGCTTDAVSLTGIDPYMAYVVTLYQRASTNSSARSAALEGDGWELLETRTIPPALSGCRINSGNGSNTVVCYDNREETDYQVCYSQSPFTLPTDSGVTCVDFSIESGARILWSHTGLSNGEKWYYSIGVQSADGSSSSLPTSSGQTSSGTPNPTGCTDSTANNYDSGAVINDGSCTYTVATSSGSGSGGGGGSSCTNSLSSCPAGMVHFNCGTFSMGDGNAANNPAHTVTLSDFCIDTKEVTQAQHQTWGADTTWTAYAFDANANCGGSRTTCPAEQVDWTNAKAYCVAQGKRLPTEAEWEYAARNGGAAAVYATGENGTPDSCGNLANGNMQANYNSCNGGGATSAVGSYAASTSGLFDMAGNVYEWTGDWYDANYYANGQTNPTGPASGTTRVVRGGSWNPVNDFLRASFRGFGTPAGRSVDIGFRCASN